MIERLRARIDLELSTLRQLPPQIAGELGEKTQPIASRWTIQFQALLRKLQHSEHQDFAQLTATAPVPKAIQSNAEGLRGSRMLVSDKVVEL